MALQIWCPFTTNFRNLGIIGELTKTNNPSITSGGKLGNCITNSNGYFTFSQTTFPASTGFTCCAWVYITNLNKTNGLVSNTESGPVYSGCLISNGKLDYWHYNNGWLNSYGNTTLSANTWYHVAFVILGTTVKFYVNGEPDGELDGTTGSSNYLNVICRSYYGSSEFTGKINDLRIYDNPLGPQDIKDISKGLMLHYTLGKESVVEKNLVDGYPIDGSINNGTISVENGIATINNTSGSWCRVVCRNESTSNTNLANAGVTNKTVTVSFDILMISGNVPTIFITDAYRGVTGVDASKTGVWQRAYCTFTHAGDNSSYHYFTPHFSSTGNYKIKNIKVVIGNVQDYFSEYNQGKIAYDSSGYNYNGDIIGTIGTNTSTPRYNSCVVFDGSTSAIQTGLNFSNYGNDFTLSAWVKSNVNNGGYLTAIGNELSNGGIVFGELVAANSIQCYLNGTSGADINKCGYNYFTANTWYHVVYTVKDALSAPKAKLYINGTLASSADGTAPFGEPDLPIIIGCNRNYRFWNGNISDFRIYATALSQQDITDLYSLGASIS